MRPTKAGIEELALVAQFLPKPITKGTLVYPQRGKHKAFKTGGKPGTTTGGGRYCSCGSFRSGVRWPNGELTFCCHKALTRHEDGSWEIDQPW